MTLIRLRNIQKSFSDGENRQRQVLQRIDLNVERGEMISIRGESGSGKTTLLSILGTILRADAGVYTLDEENVSQIADTSRLRASKIGFLFQDHRLMPQYTALENILLPLLATADTTSTEEEAYAEQLMQLLHVDHLRNQYPSTLSGGEASRVALCRALIRKPQLLLADEPTGQLDDRHSEQVAELLHTVNKELGTTIIIVTHSEHLATKAHRQFLLTDGILNEL